MNEFMKNNFFKDPKLIEFMFTRDRFFKYVFLSQDKDSLYLCNLLLKEILDMQYQKIYSINTHFSTKEHEKEMICDALFDVGDEIKVNMEMQNQTYHEMGIRFDMYMSKIFIAGVKNYDEARKVLQILFINSHGDNDDLKRCSMFKDDKCRTTTQSWTRVEIFLKSIDKIVKQKGIENISEFEKLIYIFAKSNIYDIIKSEKRVGKITEVTRIMERKITFYLSENDEDLRLFNEYHKELEQRARIEEARNKAMEQGMKQGIEQGMKQGMKQGIEQGIQMEREHNNKKMMDAIIHLSINMNIGYTKAMDILNISKEEQEMYLKLLNV